MNKIDTLFASMFLLCFAPIAALYVVGIVTSIMGRPTRWNRSLIMPVWLLAVGVVVMGTSALAFHLTGLPHAAQAVFGICLVWVMVNIAMVVTATHFYPAR